MLYNLCKLNSQVKINKDKHIMAKICDHNNYKNHIWLTKCSQHLWIDTVDTTAEDHMIFIQSIQ